MKDKRAGLRNRTPGRFETFPAISKFSGLAAIPSEGATWSAATPRNITGVNGERCLYEAERSLGGSTNLDLINDTQVRWNRLRHLSQ